MATKLVYRITAIDNASSVAQKFRNNLARISSPISKLTNSLSRTSKIGASALGKLNSGFQTVERAARSVSDRIASIIPGMAALTGLAGTAGIGALAERWGRLGFNLRNTSRQLGMSTQGLQAWHYAAQRAGVSAEQFDQSMVSSQNTIREAAFGGNPQAMMLLNRLGVQISRGKDGQIDYQKTQHDIMQALGRIKNPAGQRTAADALGMGSLLPMIQRGTFDTDRQKAVMNGFAPGDDAIQRAAAFQDRINGLTAGATSLANTIGDKLIPVLQPMVEKFTAWLNDHQIDIANRLADAVGKFTQWIDSVDWGSWYDRVNKIVDKFGGWGTVIETLIGLKFAGTVLGWTSALAGLAGTLGKVKTAAEGVKAAVGVGAAAEGAGAAATTSWLARMAPWAARAAPWAAGAGLMFYSKNLNQGEDAILEESRRGNGKRYLSPQEAAPGGVSDPKILNIARRFMDMGWSKAQATGIAANILQESGGNEYSIGDGGQAYGIGQWHGDRQNDFKRVFGKDIRSSSLEEQIKFYDWELRNGPGMQRKAGDLLGKATDEGSAAAIVSKYHERPADVEGEQIRRAAMARDIYRNLGGNSSESAQAPQVGASNKEIADALRSAIKETALQVNVTAPPGTRVEAKNSNGENLPARISYSMGLGAMP